MIVRIPIAKGEGGAPHDEDGGYAFVIVDTKRITSIGCVSEVSNRRDDPPHTMRTTTTIRLLCGAEIVIRDEDLCQGWTHHYLIGALGWKPRDPPGIHPPKQKKRKARTR